MDYETLRHAADSWGLVFLVVLFLGACLWVFRPGSKEIYDRQSRLPLDED